MKYIKLFEHTYTIYDLIAMPMSELTKLLFNEIKKTNPDVNLVRDILEYSIIDVNQPEDEDGYTALMWASSNGHTEIVKMIQAKNNTI